MFKESHRKFQEYRYVYEGLGLCGQVTTPYPGVGRGPTDRSKKTELYVL